MIERKKCQQLIQKDGIVCECSRFATHYVSALNSSYGVYICTQHVKYILKYSPNVVVIEMQGCK